MTGFVGVNNGGTAEEDISLQNADVDEVLDDRDVMLRTKIRASEALNARLLLHSNEEPSIEYENEVLALTEEFQEFEFMVPFTEFAAMRLMEYAKVYDLQLDTTSGGVDVATDQDAFPVCVHISSDNMSAAARGRFFDDTNNPGGKRCSFYMEGDKETALPYEVEMYDAAGEEAIYWVLVSVSGNDDTSLNKLLVAYGDGTSRWATTDQDNTVAVWNGFISVFHMNEDHASGAFYDSAELQDLTNVGSTSGTGKVDKGRAFDGDDHLYAPHDDSHWLDTNGSVSALLKHPTIGGSSATIIDKRNINAGTGDDTGDLGGYIFFIWTDGKLRFVIQDTVGPNESVSINRVDDDAWHYLGGVYNGTDIRTYVDAALDGVPATCTKTPTPTIERLGLGCNTEDLNEYLLNGTLLDEVRVHASARSADWMKLEHYSMKKTLFNGDDLVTWGAEAAIDPENTVKLLVGAHTQDNPYWVEVDYLSVNLVTHSFLPVITHEYTAGQNGDQVYVKRDLWWLDEDTQMWEYVGISEWLANDGVTYQTVAGDIKKGTGDYRFIVKVKDGDVGREACENSPIYVEDSVDMEILEDLSDDAIVDVDGVLETVLYEEYSADIDYSGTWAEIVDDIDTLVHSKDKAQESSETGAYASFQFYGGEVKWIGDKGPDMGIAWLFIDGIGQTPVDMYAASAEYQQELFTIDTLTNDDETLHTIKIEVSGTKHASSSGYRIVLDAYSVKGHNIPFPATDEEELELDPLSADIYDYYRDEE